MVITSITIICTLAYNNFADAQNELKLKAQRQYDSLLLRKQDSLSNLRLDSSNNNTTALLARYGYKVDSIHNILIKDTGKVTNITYGKEPILLFSNPIATIESNPDSTQTFHLAFIADNAPIRSATISVGTAFIYNGKYTLAFPLSKKTENFAISETAILTIPVTLRLHDSGIFKALLLCKSHI
jgi:hypothetical protein